MTIDKKVFSIGKMSMAAAGMNRLSPVLAVDQGVRLISNSKVNVPSFLNI